MTTVIRSGPKFELLSENDLQDYTLSSPAVSDGQISFGRLRSFMRSHAGRRRRVYPVAVEIEGRWPHDSEGHRRRLVALVLVVGVLRTSFSVFAS